MNDLRLKSIFDLLDKNYFIPSYQRGYRWEKRQIEDLLDDLYAFAKSKKDVESFYCLQPVILKPCDSKTIQENHLNSNIDNNKWYEVIDGQQRLTTIYIIFKYLINKENVTLEDDFKKSLYKISYQTKSDEEQRYIDYPEEYDESTPNACFVTQAYKDIDAWFAKSEAPKKTRGIILNCLTNQKKDEAAEGYVQVIWYELPEEQDPIKTFTRVNIGKIPLTNSELIKALFLQKREKNEIAEVQQIQISKEWDQIEYSLQDKSIWAFLNKDLIDMPAHIDFLFNLMGDLEKERIGVEEFNKKYGTDSFATFRLFNEKFTNATQDTVKNEWEVVREYYDTFMEWYSNSIWYHYIGFLIYCNKPIIDIYKLYKDASKDEFLTSIEEEIKSVFAEVFISIADKKEHIELSYDNKQKDILRELLLLYNIEFIVQKKDSYIRFPFDLFKDEKWDIEHIDSYTTNELKDNNEQKLWVQTALADLKEISKEPTGDYKTIIDEFLNKKDTASQYKAVKMIISELAGEFIPTENTPDDVKNSIGNLTLLNADINRGYGNAIFPTKRRSIIEKDASGRFIPICTKNVFLKYFVTRASSNVSWNQDDMEEYHNDIIKVLGKYLSRKEVKKNG